MSELNPDRFFSPEPTTRRLARELYESVATLPIVSPHGHVEPRLFADPQATFGSPASLFIIPDHYVTRMLYSQGIALENLGVPRQDGGVVEADHGKIWRLFCENYHLFQGTPSGIWLTYELSEVFAIREKPSAANADRLYEAIAEKLAAPEYTPRALYERFNVEALCTTDAATDDLTHHQAIRASGWKGRILPTFRPDAVLNLEAPGWQAQIDKLRAASGIEVVDFASFIRALEQRREYFRALGAVATDHAVLLPATAELSPGEAEAIFQRALKSQSAP